MAPLSATFSDGRIKEDLLLPHHEWWRGKRVLVVRWGSQVPHGLPRLILVSFSGQDRWAKAFKTALCTVCSCTAASASTRRVPNNQAYLRREREPRQGRVAFIRLGAHEQGTGTGGLLVGQQSHRPNIVCTHSAFASCPNTRMDVLSEHGCTLADTRSSDFQLRCQIWDRPHIPLCGTTMLKASKIDQ